jgi:hypothetical protein
MMNLDEKKERIRKVLIGLGGLVDDSLKDVSDTYERLKESEIKELSHGKSMVHASPVDVLDHCAALCMFLDVTQGIESIYKEILKDGYMETCQASLHTIVNQLKNMDKESHEPES